MPMSLLPLMVKARFRFRNRGAPCAPRRSCRQRSVCMGLRHSLASHMAMNGAEAAEIMTALGHRQLSTAQRYVHWAQDARQALAEKAAAVALAGMAAAAGAKTADLVPIKERTGEMTTQTPTKKSFSLCDSFAEWGTLWIESEMCKVKWRDADTREVVDLSPGVRDHQRKVAPIPDRNVWRSVTNLNLHDCYAELAKRCHAGEITGTGCLDSPHGPRIVFRREDWELLKRCRRVPSERGDRSKVAWPLESALWLPDGNDRFPKGTMFFDCLFTDARSASAKKRSANKRSGERSGPRKSLPSPHRTPDKEAMRVEFQNKVKTVGAPGTLGEKGWQGTNDVARWLQDRCNVDEELGWSTAQQWAKDFIQGNSEQYRRT
jgi:hypothetical protein